MSKSEIEKPIEIKELPSQQIMYADRIVGFAVGPAVSKLTLGMELTPTTYAPTVTLVIPTLSLIESIDFIQKTIRGSEAIKADLNAGINLIREQYESL